MKLLNTHVYKLRFSLDNDAPKEYIKRWDEFKYNCENSENEYIVEQIKSYSKLNKKLPYLNRSEGGMGGDNNLVNKQIRFGFYWGPNDYRCRDNDIMFDEIINTKKEKWTVKELDDLIYAFIKTANFNVKSNCVTGHIEMFNRNILCDSYLDE